MDCDLETRLANSKAKIDEIHSKQEELRKKFTSPPMGSNSNMELKEKYRTYLDYWLQELQNQQVILNEAKYRLQQGATVTEKSSEEVTTVTEKSSEEVTTIKFSLTQIDVWMKELEEIKNKNKELKSKLTQLTDENTILRSACDTLNEQVTKLDKKCTNLNTAYNTQNEQITNLVDDNHNLQKQVTNLNVQVAELVEDNHDLKKQVANLNNAYNTQNEQMTYLHGVIDNWNARYEEIIKRLPPP